MSLDSDLACGLNIHAATVHFTYHMEVLMTHKMNIRIRLAWIAAYVFMLGVLVSTGSSFTRLAETTGSSTRHAAQCFDAFVPPPAEWEPGSYKRLLNELEEVVKLWEDQVRRFKNHPQPTNCQDMLRWLEEARAQVAMEREKLAEARKNPPTKDNANRGIIAGWVKYMNDWSRDLKQAEKSLDDLERRITALGC